MFRISFILTNILIPFFLYSQDVYVKGYVKKNGEYVAPHYRSPKNENFYDNFSTLGNINPYTLKLGWKTEKSYSNYVKVFNPSFMVDDISFENAVVNNDIAKLDFFLKDLHEDEKSLIKILSFMFVEQYTQARELAERIKRTTDSMYIEQEIDNWLETIDLILASKELEVANIDLKHLSLERQDLKEMKPLIKKLKNLKEKENQWLKNELSLLIYFHTDDIEGLKLLEKEMSETGYVSSNNLPEINELVSLIEQKTLRESLINKSQLNVDFGLLLDYFSKYLIENTQKRQSNESIKFIKIFEDKGFKSNIESLYRQTMIDTSPPKFYADRIEINTFQVDSTLRIHKLMFNTNDSILYDNLYNSFRNRYNFINYGTDSSIGLLIDRKVKERFGHPNYPINIEFYETKESEVEENFFFLDLICIEQNGAIIYYNSKKQN